MESHINGHNKKITSANKTSEEQGEGCNCRKKENCPVDGKCQRKSVIYEATVKSTEGVKKYIGMAETTFKVRYTNHMMSLRNENYRNKTTLSNYIWDLKNNQVSYDIDWRLIDRSSTYDGTNRRCSLCLLEKFYILNGENLLNKRTELISKCRHRNKYAIKKV